MKLFDIPDIRLFWSEDPRFLSQFHEHSTTKFKPFSKYPPVYKDISFWVNDEGFSPNDLFEIARGIGGDVIEEVGKHIFLNSNPEVIFQVLYMYTLVLTIGWFNFSFLDKVGCVHIYSNLLIRGDLKVFCFFAIVHIFNQGG